MEVKFTTGHLYRVPTARGKQGKWRQKNCQGKHREFRNFAKTQGIWFAQVVNSLYFYICRENFHFFLRLEKSAKSVLCM